MVLGLLKWLKETRFYKNKKKNIIKKWTLLSRQEVGRKKKVARCFKKWKLYFSPQKKENNDRIFSLAWNIVYWLLKTHCFELFGGAKYSLFWAKKSMEIWYLLITEKFLFWTFRGWKIRSFLRQKVDGKMIFTGYWKVFVLSFSMMENAVFLVAKS